MTQIYTAKVAIWSVDDRLADMFDCAGGGWYCDLLEDTSDNINFFLFWIYTFFYKT
jgi:hypothetical protein